MPEPTSPPRDPWQRFIGSCSVRRIDGVRIACQAGRRRYQWRGFSRRSSAVEHPLRKRVVGGSNPSAGTTTSPTENRPESVPESIPAQPGDGKKPIWAAGGKLARKRRLSRGYTRPSRTHRFVSNCQARARPRCPSVAGHAGGSSENSLLIPWDEPRPLPPHSCQRSAIASTRSRRRSSIGASKCILLANDSVTSRVPRARGIYADKCVCSWAASV